MDKEAIEALNGNDLSRNSHAAVRGKKLIREFLNMLL